MNPECKSGKDVQVHHIVPLSQAGIDKPENLIALCRECHLKLKLHENFAVEEIKLATYKEYYENWPEIEEIPSLEEFEPQQEKIETIPQEKCVCGCGEWFIPMRSWQKYLNDEHRKRAHEKAPRFDKTKVDKLRVLLAEASEILEGL